MLTCAMCRWGCVAVTLGFALLGPSQAPPSLFAPAPGSPFPVGRQPADVALADMNGDGRLDIVTANSGSSDVSILLGDGRGGFRAAPHSPVDAGPRPHLIAVGDFNEDGRADLAVTEHDSNGVRILLAASEGRFAAAPGSPFAALEATPPHNHGLALADVNRDGRLDIVTANQNHHSVSVLLGDGKGAFTPAAGSPFRAGRDPYNPAVGDVNGDGAADIITPNVRGNSLTVLAGDGRGGFREAAGSPYAVPHRPYYAALGDVNGDGRLDILASHDDITLVSVLLNDGSGRFRSVPGAPVDIGHRGWKLALGDINGDGKLDLATGTASHNVVVWLGDGTGRFRAAPGSPYAVGRGPWGVALGDLNADSKLDLVAVSFEGHSVSVLLAR